VTKLRKVTSLEL